MVGGYKNGVMYVAYGREEEGRAGGRTGKEVMFRHIRSGEKGSIIFFIRICVVSCRHVYWYWYSRLYTGTNFVPSCVVSVSVIECCASFRSGGGGGFGVGWRVFRWDKWEGRC